MGRRFGALGLRTVMGADFRYERRLVARRKRYARDHGDMGVAMKKFRTCIGILLSLLLVASAMADSWIPARVKSYASSDGTWKLTIYPRKLTSPLGYFQDKVDGKSNAGAVPGDSQKSPIGHMERKEGDQWRTAWKAPLVNEVAPVQALVSNTGVAVTFDNWHSVGYGEDAVVVYTVDGEPVRKFGLSAFLPKYYIDALPHSVSSIDWRGEPRLDDTQRQLVIPVVVPTAEGQEDHTDKQQYIDVRFLLADGSLVPMAGKVWQNAIDSATKADARRRELEEEQRNRFISPLAAPRDGDVTAWYRYLTDAFFRIDPDWEDGYPSTTVVPLASDPKFALLRGYLGEALSDDMNADGVIMVASPSQDVLVSALQNLAKRAKRGFLAQARVYVAADDAHMPAVRAALAHTGAKVIQLDIDDPIPQRKETLERYLRNNDSE